MSASFEITRLRWLLVILIAVDVALTLAGQPSGFWGGSGTIKEANPLFAWFLAKGLVPFLVFMAAYSGALFWVVVVLPRRAGLVVLLSFVFGHYFGASSWLMYHLKLGILAPVLYGILLAVTLVVLGKEKKEPDKMP